MKTTYYNDWIKDQFIMIAKHHKKHCDGENCKISLSSMLEAMVKLDIELSKDEIGDFL